MPRGEHIAPGVVYWDVSWCWEENEGKRKKEVWVGESRGVGMLRDAVHRTVDQPKLEGTSKDHQV